MDPDGWTALHTRPITRFTTAIGPVVNLFNIMICNGYVPMHLVNSVSMPLLKDNKGDICNRTTPGLLPLRVFHQNCRNCNTA